LEKKPSHIVRTLNILTNILDFYPNETLIKNIGYALYDFTYKIEPRYAALARVYFFDFLRSNHTKKFQFDLEKFEELFIYRDKENKEN
jgi:hypothetical protein